MCSNNCRRAIQPQRVPYTSAALKPRRRNGATWNSCSPKSAKVLASSSELAGTGQLPFSTEERSGLVGATEIMATNADFRHAHAATSLAPGSEGQQELGNPAESQSQEGFPRHGSASQRPPLRHLEVHPEAAGRRFHRGTGSGNDEGPERCNRGEVRLHPQLSVMIRRVTKTKQHTKPHSHHGSSRRCRQGNIYSEG